MVVFADISLEFCMARVLVGTSGWGYRSWRGPFFPMNIPANHQLKYYASQFDTVELNGVFYRTPTAESVRGIVTSSKKRASRGGLPIH